MIAEQQHGIKLKNMTSLQKAQQQLQEMLKKYPKNKKLSVELQALYTLVQSAINEPISLEEVKQIRANDIHNCPQGTTWSDSANKCVPNV